MKLIIGIGVVFGGLAISAPPAAAQTADFSDMNAKGAPRVIVTDQSGQETRGRLVSWTPAAIVLDANGAKRAYSPGEAVRVDLRGDSVKNGMIIGAAVGGLLGLAVGCPTTGSQAEGCAAERVTFALVEAGLFALIGAGIDALIPGRTRLWSAGSPQKSARGLTFDLSPRDRRASIAWRLSSP